MSGDDWRPWALCAEIDLELWFPHKGDRVASRTAKAICQQCPVLVECLEEALTEGYDYGVWGGTTGRERRGLHARKGAAA